MVEPPEKCRYCDNPVYSTGLRECYDCIRVSLGPGAEYEDGKDHDRDDD